MVGVVLVLFLLLARLDGWTVVVAILIERPRSIVQVVIVVGTVPKDGIVVAQATVRLAAAAAAAANAITRAIAQRGLVVCGFCGRLLPHGIPLRVCGKLPILLGDGHQQTELRGKLVLGVQAVGEVDPTNATIGVDLNPQSFDVVGAVRPTGKVAQIELDLVPTLVQPHGHGADEGLDARRRLVVGGTEPTPDVLIVQYLNLEREVLVHVLEDHHQERQLDAQGLLGIGRTNDVVGRHVRSHDFHHRALDIRVGYALHMTILYRGVPYL
mmetsp:Transcript_28691/g.83113  ORF Transcript_28691/g.83113 Transcript_28691/m.83113 type:complete len:269 (-) Transcript_28691:399-1205(-)